MSTDLQTRFRVGGMDCASCASKIDTAVRRMPGVEDVSVSVTAGTMSIRHDQTSDLDAIGKKVRGLGYSVERLAGRQVDNQTSANHGAACCGGHAHDHADGDSHTHSGPATTTTTMPTTTIATNMANRTEATVPPRSRDCMAMTMGE